MGVVRVVYGGGTAVITFRAGEQLVDVRNLHSLGPSSPMGVDSFAKASQRSAEQAGLRETVLAHLKRGDFDCADALYDKCCATWWPRDSYGTQRRKIKADRAAQEQSDHRARVEAYLDDGDIDLADTGYIEYCKTWWDEADYQQIRSRAIALRQLIEIYSASSLARLDAFYNKTMSQWISAGDFARIKLPKMRARLARLGLPLDEEQLVACARPEHHRLIRARAGSGKTRTLAALAALSIQDEALDPDQVLILAFNKAAAQEIGGRVRNAAGILEYRNARTFHSLAWQLADHAGRDLIFDDGDLSPSRRKQTGFAERLIASIMNPAFREDLYEFFRHELEQLDRLGSGLSREQYITYRRSMADYTLGGETVKSNGEKFIADFLFEHGLSYKYEQVYSWDKKHRLNGTSYRPDFSMIESGREFILEHWAIDPDDRSAQVPDWWETSTHDYREQIVAKRAFWAKRGVTLLETHAGMLTAGRKSFESALRVLFGQVGLHCRKLDHDVLVQRVAEAPRTVSRMAELFMQFISRAKKRGWSVDAAARAIRDAPDLEPRNRIFHQLAVHAYGGYERALAEQSAMDFDDLLISAAECVRQQGGAMHLSIDRNHSIAIRDLRWILIDEFQDFSELYFQLIRAMLDANPSIRVVAVGDDWQAINGFAGAQLTFFNCFGEYFGGAGEASISTNRRSGRTIVSAGNQIMAGRGEPALAHHRANGDIRTIYVDKVWVQDASIYGKAATILRNDGQRSINWDLAKALKACADGIVESADANSTHQKTRQMPSVLLLARTGHAYNVSLSEFGRRLEQVLREHPKLQELTNTFAVGRKLAGSYEDVALIEVMTAHRAKGKEADTVIVLEAVARHFPKVHADNQLYCLFGASVEDVLAEERRLFYVALTRAERRVILLSETVCASPFLEPLEGAETAAQGDPVRPGMACGPLATGICGRLEARDPRELIRSNISREASSAWERLHDLELGLPEVGYNLKEGLTAELAWPRANPPVAIIVGHQKARSKEWEAHGWRVQLGRI